MVTDEIKELNRLWHVLLKEMQSKMTIEKYSHISELSTTEISVLQLLHDHPNIILKEICQRLDIPKSTLTSAVNRLVEKGYVERVSVSGDKRAFALHISEKGKAAQTEHLEYEYQILSNLLIHLQYDEIETLLRLLTKAVGGNSDAQR